MKTIKIIPAIAFATFLFFSCTKVLDKRDLTALQPDLVFNDSNMSVGYIDYIYNQNLPTWGGTSGTLADRSDESYGDNKYVEGTLTINDVTDFGTSLTATTSPWVKIRAINDCIQQVEAGALSKNLKDKIKGQAYFFRAWRYFELVKMYGGVPLVLTPLPAVGDANKEAAALPRSKTSECIAQIVKDLDSSALLLPGKWDDATKNGANWGRITSGAALALKGRVLTYWASPEFNPTQAVDRWEAAYQANLQARTVLEANGYGLNPDYTNMWYNEVNNPEAVFVTEYNTSSDDQFKKNNPYDNPTRPKVAGGSGSSNQPVKELVDAYPMKDGKQPGSSAYAYDPQTFYNNRDPRFYATIAYNGCTWTLNSTEYPRFWFYYASGSTYAPYTANTTETSPTNTGFFCRKAINPSLSTSAVPYCGTDWMEIRFAEVLLNLAEAACGTNRLSEAYDQLIAIRKRAGIEAGDNGMYGLKTGMTQQEMVNAILLERKIEFAFEGKRYWDMRRYKLFETELNGKRRTGTAYTFQPSEGIPTHDAFLQVRDNITLDSAYKNNLVLKSKQMDTYDINWRPEYYFFALPQVTLDNNTALQQTAGWPNGTFDPLQ